MIREQVITAELQDLVNLIESKQLILAKVLLPEITELPEYNQYMVVQDINIALSQGHLKIIPCRVLIHKITGAVLKLNLPIPDWTKSLTDVTAILDEQGNRILVPATYSDYITPEPTEEDPNPESNLSVIETKNEPVLVPTLQYLITIVENKKFLEAIELFTEQFIEDEQLVNPNIFTTLPK